MHVEDRRVLVELECEETAGLDKSLLGRIKLSNERMKASQGLVPEHAEIVTLGLIAEQHATVFECIGFLTERGSRVLQLCLEFQEVFAHLGKE